MVVLGFMFCFGVLNYRLFQKFKLLENGEFNHLTINLTGECVGVVCCSMHLRYPSYPLMRERCGYVWVLGQIART